MSRAACFRPAESATQIGQTPPPLMASPLSKQSIQAALRSLSEGTWLFLKVSQSADSRKYRQPNAA